MKKIATFLVLLLTTISLFAQGENNAGGASGLFRSDLKIYVVVMVLLIIFSGIIVFLFSMERRLKRLEEKS